MTPEKVKLVFRLMQDSEASIPEICKTLAISRSTLYRYVGLDGTVRQPITGLRVYQPSPYCVPHAIVML
jgi:hypothetical protein